MSEIITYVGIDAHKRELHVAMVVEAAATDHALPSGKRRQVGICG